MTEPLYLPKGSVRAILTLMIAVTFLIAVLNRTLSIDELEKTILNVCKMSTEQLRSQIELCQKHALNIFSRASVKSVKF